jgi:hypothetical protein
MAKTWRRLPAKTSQQLLDERLIRALTEVEVEQTLECVNPQATARPPSNKQVCSLKIPCIFKCSFSNVHFQMFIFKCSFSNVHFQCSFLSLKKFEK